MPSMVVIVGCAPAENEKKRAEAILAKSCVVEGFEGQEPNCNSQTFLRFSYFFPKSRPNFCARELGIPK